MKKATDFYPVIRGVWPQSGNFRHICPQVAGWRFRRHWTAIPLMLDSFPERSDADTIAPLPVSNMGLFRRLFRMSYRSAATLSAHIFYITSFYSAVRLLPDCPSGFFGSFPEEALTLLLRMDSPCNSIR